MSTSSPICMPYQVCGSRSQASAALCISVPSHGLLPAKPGLPFPLCWNLKKGQWHVWKQMRCRVLVSQVGGTLTTSFTCQQAGPAGHRALPATCVPACPHLSFSQAVCVQQGHSLFPSHTKSPCLWFLNSAWKRTVFLWQELHQGGERGQPHCRTKNHDV